ncbi:MULTISPECIES: FtsX-like permease family protein [Bacteria]|uniref:FtsX-like permease family protein n=1 Tax=Bacteria TaxID=2 RepID=UPI003C7C4B4E
MRTLILRDLRAHVSSRLGPFLAIVVATIIVGFGVAWIDTAVRVGGERAQTLTTTGVSVLVGSLIAAALVIGAVMKLSSGLRQRDYALWQLAGIAPNAVRRIILWQGVLLGVLGAATGCIGAALVAPSLGAMLSRPLSGPDPHLSLSVGGFAVVIVVIGGVTALSSLPAARRAARTPALIVLREPAPSLGRMRWLQLLALVLLLAAVALVVSRMRSGERAEIVYLGILLGPLVAAVLSAAGPVVFPLVLRAWTAVIPPRMSVAWFLARRGAQLKALQASAGITALLLALTFASTFFAVTGTATNAVALTGEVSADYYAFGSPAAFATLALLVGGPVLLSAVGAAVVVFVAGRDKNREIALLRACGARPPRILTVAVLEAVIHAVTAFILALIAVGAASMAVALGFLPRTETLVSPVVPLDILLPAFGVALVLVIAATLLPTIAALRRDVPEALSAT